MTQPRFNYLDFAAILAQVVRAYKPTYGDDDKEIKYLRPNTFAFLKSENELNTDNLGKDFFYHDLKYFYSRKWESNDYAPSALGFEYPLIGLSIDMFSIPTGNRQHENVSMNLYAVDQIPKNDKTTVRRSWEQTSLDLKNILVNVYKEALNFAYGTLSTSNGTTEGYFSLGHIQELKDASPTNAFLELFTVEPWINTEILTAEYFPIAFGDDISGLFCNISVSSNECFDRENKFSYEDYTENPITSSCITC